MCPSCDDLQKTRSLEKLFDVKPRVQPSRSRNHCREGSSTVLDTSLLHLKKPTQHLIPGRPVSGASTQRRTAAHGILHCKCTCCRFPRQPAAGSSSEMPCSLSGQSQSHWKFHISNTMRFHGPSLQMVNLHEARDDSEGKKERRK